MSEWWYSVDRDDRVTEVSPGWNEFADENDSPGARAENVIGRPLLDFIQGSQTRQMIRLLFERVRGASEPVELSLRCDSPSVRRFMSWRGVSGPEGEVRVETRLVGAEERNARRILDRKGPRQPIRMCSWCNRFAAGPGLWLELEEAADRLGLFLHDEVPEVTHGICPACSATLSGSAA